MHIKFEAEITLFRSPSIWLRLGTRYLWWHHEDGLMVGRE